MAARRQGRGRRPRGTAEATKAAAPARRQGAGRGRPRADAELEEPLGFMTLRAVEALGNGLSAEQIRTYLVENFGVIDVQPNQIAIALRRHLRAGRLQEEDGRWAIVRPPQATNREHKQGFRGARLPVRRRS